MVQMMVFLGCLWCSCSSFSCLWCRCWSFSCLWCRCWSFSCLWCRCWSFSCLWCRCWSFSCLWCRCWSFSCLWCSCWSFNCLWCRCWSFSLPTLSQRGIARSGDTRASPLFRVKELTGQVDCVEHPVITTKNLESPAEFLALCWRLDLSCRRVKTKAQTLESTVFVNEPVAAIQIRGQALLKISIDRGAHNRTILPEVMSC